MATTRLLTITIICASFIFTEARWHSVKRRGAETPLCDINYSNVSKVQCYCVKHSRDTILMTSAECFITHQDVKQTDPIWKEFKSIGNVHKLTFTNNRKVALKYIPSEVFKYTNVLQKLEIKYANVHSILPYAFANSSSITEITVRDSDIAILEVNSFAHHKNLISINFDKNNIVEINRNVYVDLPRLEQLFLTSNKITTLHDRAFVHLTNLKELEINMNSIFSLNSESFAGLGKLQILDLSSNSLEVVGDNTFLPLINLRSLNLEGNKIQMIDANAFRGLAKLQSLSLAHNTLTNIDNVNIFANLKSLASLSLKGNKMRELKKEIVEPIINNLYKSDTSLDVEDNKFDCNCRLDWFLILLNKTESKSMKIALENLKCAPDDALQAAWTKLEEEDKNSAQFSSEDAQGSSDYEYYDESQLHGKLFYTDVRFLLNCSTELDIQKLIYPEDESSKSTKETTKETSSISTTTLKPSLTKVIAPKTIEVKPKKETKLINGKSLLDLSDYDEMTPPVNEANKKAEHSFSNEINHEKKPDHTTNRLTTVSEKPAGKGFYEDGMASDEAKPDKMKAHRSVQELHNHLESKLNSSTSNNVSRGFIISILICVRLI